MTSKNFSSNIPAASGVSVWKLGIAAFRRNMWLATLACVGFFFTLPVVSALIMQDGSRGLELDIAMKEAQLRGMMGNVLQMNQAFSTIIICLGAIMAALAVFHYLQKSKQVDFYHSLPIKRGKLFGINYLAGFLLFLIPYAICTILNLLVIVCFGNAGYMAWGVYFAHIGSNILFFLAIYNVAILAIMLTGTMLVACKVSAILLFIGPVLTLLYAGFLQMFYETFYMELFPVDFWLYNTSPLIKYVSYTAMGNMSGLSYLAVFVFAAILGVFAYLLYNKRPSESAGKAIAFPHSKAVIKYPIVAIIALVFSIFFYSIGGNSIPWMFFGTVCGTLISSQLLEILYQADFKAIKKGLVGMLVTLALVCVVLGGMLIHGPKFDHYVPQADQVVKVNVYLPQVINSQEGISYNNYVSFEDEGLDTPEWGYLNRYTLEDPIAIEGATQLAQVAVNRIDNSSEWEVPSTGRQFVSKDSTNMGIVYTLANGKQVARYYYNIPTQDNKEVFEKLMNNDAYKNSACQLLEADLSRTFMVSSNNLRQDIDPRLYTAEENQAIVQAFIEEYQGMSMSERMNAVPVGCISFSVFEDPELKSISLQQVLNDDSDIRQQYRTLDYPLYANNTKTIALLTAHGNENLFANSIEGLTSITVYSETKYDVDRPATNYEGGTLEAETAGEYGRIVRTITDPAEMADVLASTYPGNAFGWVPFLTRDLSLRYVCNYDNMEEVERYALVSD